MTELSRDDIAEVLGRVGDAIAAEIVGGKLEAGFDEVRVLLDGQTGILVFVVEDPALTFGDGLVAEFFDGELVSPLAERAFGELLDVALVDEGHRLALVVNGMVDGHADQTLGTGHRHRFDADA